MNRSLSYYLSAGPCRAALTPHPGFTHPSAINGLLFQRMIMASHSLCRIRRASSRLSPPSAHIRVRARIGYRYV